MIGIGDSVKHPRFCGAAIVASVVTMVAGCGALPSYESVRAGLPADELVQLNGQWVHFERTGEGVPVVLLHGFGESTYTWRQVMPGLGEGFDTIAIDLNGFGYTQRPTGTEPYLIDGQVELVLRLMDHLGLENAHIVGHSYGTGVAARLADGAPDRVRTLVLIAGVPGSDDAGQNVIPPLVRPFLLYFVKQFLLTPAQVRDTLASVSTVDTYITDVVVDEYLKRLRVEGLDRAVDGLLAQLEVGPLDVDLAAITQPTLIVWGAEDLVYPLELGQTLADLVPNATLVVFEDTGHVVMEERPDKLLETITPFLLAH